MARRADTPCAGCGKLIFKGTGSRPPGEAMCRSCRSAHCGKTGQATCAHCSKPFVSVRHAGKWTETCSVSCGQQRHWRAKGVPPGGDPERVKAKWRAQNHRRRARCRATYDQVTPAYELDLRARAKRCPLCRLRLTDTPLLPSSKELDHIVPLNVGGTHTVGNVRIICRGCNIRRPGDGSDYSGPVTLWAQDFDLAAAG